MLAVRLHHVLPVLRKLHGRIVVGPTERASPALATALAIPAQKALACQTPRASWGPEADATEHLDLLHVGRGRAGLYPGALPKCLSELRFKLGDSGSLVG